MSLAYAQRRHGRRRSKLSPVQTGHRRAGIGGGRHVWQGKVLGGGGGLGGAGGDAAPGGGVGTAGHGRLWGVGCCGRRAPTHNSTEHTEAGPAAGEHHAPAPGSSTPVLAGQRARPAQAMAAQAGSDVRTCRATLPTPDGGALPLFMVASRGAGEGCLTLLATDGVHTWRNNGGVDRAGRWDWGESEREGRCSLGGGGQRASAACGTPRTPTPHAAAPPDAAPASFPFARLATPRRHTESKPLA